MSKSASRASRGAPSASPSAMRRPLKKTRPNWYLLRLEMFVRAAMRAKGASVATPRELISREARGAQGIGPRRARLVLI
eukprot:scaffold433_cov257-Pinguiococcus_pyrenoidosus.AAC.21